MELVNLFLAGAAKCGTTSFHNYLDQHPDIKMSKVKELNHFSFQDIIGNNLYYIGNTLIENSTDYLKHFDFDSEVKYYGESSVSYFQYSDVSDRIFSYNHDSKVLIFLRNPTDRAISHYHMDHNAGYFNYSIEQIINKKCPKNVYDQIIGIGFYYDKVKKYLDIFGENVSIHIMENWVGNEEIELNKIERFLKLKNHTGYSLKRINTFFSPKFKFLKKLNRNLDFKKSIKKLIPSSIISQVKNLIRDEEKPIIDQKTINQLNNLYKDDIVKLSKKLDLNLIDLWR